ncbi:hypothetical protein [Spectribacter hydrogenoxidans]|uniref:Amidohydrolase-related domain-containing protein n=1 Tax=Spectribacter hydrogenoxidans TaxID=3075608 RepID=A0ABU3BVZ7_9GAMM|nr:hypothetical protein [Salinisphaera sp. W335]MDT0633467.1 hypothetical protein [Salinisphaera sp. W335]
MSRPPRLRRLGSALVLLLLLAAGLLLAGDRWLTSLGGAFAHAPEDAEWLLTPTTRALVEASYDGLGDTPHVVDHWVHVLSRGDADNGNASFLNPAAGDFWPFRHYVALRLLLGAGGVRDRSHLDERYPARLMRQVRSLPHPHQLQIVGLDQRFDRDGQPQPERTLAYVDNERVAALAERYPDHLRAAVSIHPDRPHALAEINRWAGRGITRIAWMPALQGIDPADVRQDFYAAMAEQDMGLVVQVGGGPGLGLGKAALGNPERLRPALAAGVEVTLVLGGADSRYPDPMAEGRTVPGTELVLRMLREPDLEDQLSAVIGGVATRQHSHEALSRLLQAPDLHDRLGYASVYPLPAMAVATDLDGLRDAGYLPDEATASLHELYDLNPLLFDFVLKRQLRLPHTDLGLSTAVFTDTDNEAVTSR